MLFQQSWQYLDTMTSNTRCRPNIHTFYYLLKLCSYSQHPNAGDNAEELLSRLQIHDLLNFENQPQKKMSHASIFITVMDCWKTSAWSSRPNAAACARDYFYRIQAQRDSNITLDSTANDEDTSNDKFPDVAVLCHLLMKTCAFTRLKEDKPVALQIAFDTYREMIDSNIVPGWEIYATLLRCCRSLCTSSQHKFELSQTVFEAACQHGNVNSRLLAELRKTNAPYYKSYKPQPEHSAHA